VLAPGFTLLEKLIILPFPQTIDTLSRALSERNYDDPTPVQLAVLEAKAEGRDLVVSAQTGSGKTVAYGLAIAKTLLGGANVFPAEAKPVALIVAPTRELAMQVQRELAWLYFYAGARIVACVGGMDPKQERRKLNEGAHIIVGTPGRLRDHVERGALDITALQAVVLDEADEMLDLGFREDLEFILQATPASRRTLLFSATIPKPIANLAKRYQRDALRIETRGETRAHADIEYRCMRIAPKDVEHAVVNVLRFVEAPSAIVFCNTREHVKHLHATLSERGFSAVNLSGELSQSERNHALQALRDGRAKVCVATDVAARGIDLPQLGLVIHADLPNDAEALQHRSGRTGRAGKKGVSVVLAPSSRWRKADRLLNDAGIVPNWQPVPQADDIRRLDQQRMMQDEMLTTPASEEDLEMAKLVMASRSAEEIAAALVRIYRARLPAPEDVYDPGGGDSFKATKKFVREERSQAMTWFRMGVGRNDKADPKWLLPLICRRGNVSKPDIGAIRISDSETRFEISNAVVSQFIESAKLEAEGDVKIELATGAPEPVSDYRERKPKSGKLRFEKPARGFFEERKPFAKPDKPKHDKPYKTKGDVKKPAFEGAARPKPGTPDYDAALKKMIETGEPPPRAERKEWKKQKRK
jgi:ATP-dependent RNA helicase DeaD